MSVFLNQRKIITRPVSIFLCLSFTLFNLTANPLNSYAEVGAQRAVPLQVDLPEFIQSLVISAEFGEVTEVFVPDTGTNTSVILSEVTRQRNGVEGSPVRDPSLKKPAQDDKPIDRLVIYLQDAHANYDSEMNVRNIIHEIQKQITKKGDRLMLQPVPFFSLNTGAPEHQAPEKTGAQVTGAPVLPVLLEGGSGKLDSLFFRSFPDKKLKEKILAEYVRNGELAGGEAASILQEEGNGAYYGIENQDLYHENKKAFLEAIQAEPKVTEELNRIRSELNERAKTELSEGGKKFLDAGQAFHEERMGLLEYAKTLLSFPQSFSAHQNGGSASLLGGSGNLSFLPESISRGSRPPILRQAQDGERSRTIKAFGGDRKTKYPYLSKLLQSEHDEETLTGPDFDIAMNRLIRNFERNRLPKLSKSEQMEVGAGLQEYRTGRIHHGQLVEQISEVAPEINIPGILRPAGQHAKTISSIKGTKLFEELEKLEEEVTEKLEPSSRTSSSVILSGVPLLRDGVEGSINRRSFESRSALPQDDEAAHGIVSSSLLRQIHQLSILENFAKLELTHQDWEWLKQWSTRVPEHQAPAISDALVTGALVRLFSAHFRFYQLAEARDHALFENAMKLMDKEKTNVAILVTGGFHAEGIKEKLKNSDVSYVLISPKINQIGDKSIYLNAMTGKQSFMKYFQGSLWDALAKDYAAKVGDTLLNVGNGFKPFPTDDLIPTLKHWRDNIIQNSIKEGRITDANSYTKYVDALAEALKKENREQRTENRAVSFPQSVSGNPQFLDPRSFDRLKQILHQRVDVLTEGIRQMWNAHDFSPASVQRLLNQMNSAGTSTIAAELRLIRTPGLDIRTPSRREGLGGKPVPQGNVPMETFLGKRSIQAIVDSLPVWPTDITSNGGQVSRSELRAFQNQAPDGEASLTLEQQITNFARRGVEDGPDHFSNKTKPPFDGTEFQMTTDPSGNLYFGQWTTDGALHKIQLGLQYLPNTQVTISYVYLINPPQGLKPQWLLQVRSEKEKYFYRFKTEEGAHLEQVNLSPESYITYSAKAGVYDNSGIPPFLGTQFKMTTGPFGYLYFGGWKEGRVHEVKISSRKLSNTEVNVSYVYLINPPQGLKPQWLLQARSENEEYFYRFTTEGDHFERVDLSPEGYITSFSQGGVYNNPEIPPFLEPQFEMTTGLSGNLYFGQWWEDGKQCLVAPHLKKLPNSQVIIKKHLTPSKQWLLVVDTGDSYYQTRYYEFSPKGTLTLFKGDPGHDISNQFRKLDYWEIEQAQIQLSGQYVEDGLGTKSAWLDPVQLARHLKVDPEHLVSEVERVNGLLARFPFSQSIQLHLESVSTGQTAELRRAELRSSFGVEEKAIPIETQNVFNLVVWCLNQLAKNRNGDFNPETLSDRYLLLPQEFRDAMDQLMKLFENSESVSGKLIQTSLLNINNILRTDMKSRYVIAYDDANPSGDPFQLQFLKSTDLPRDTDRPMPLPKPQSEFVRILTLHKDMGSMIQVENGGFIYQGTISKVVQDPRIYFTLHTNEKDMDFYYEYVSQVSLVDSGVILFDASMRHSEMRMDHGEGRTDAHPNEDGQARDINRIIQQLDSEDDSSRNQAIDSLVGLGVTAVSHLIDASMSLNDKIRLGAIDTLVKLGKPAVPALVDALPDMDDLQSDAHYFDELEERQSQTGEIFIGPAEALRKIGAAAVPNLIERMRSLMNDENAGISIEGVREILIAIGKPAGKIIVREVKEVAKEIRLDRMVFPSQAAIPRMRVDEEFAWELCYTLSLLGEELQPEIFGELLENRNKPAFDYFFETFTLMNSSLSLPFLEQAFQTGASKSDRHMIRNLILQIKTTDIFQPLSSQDQFAGLDIGAIQYIKMWIYWRLSEFSEDAHTITSGVLKNIVPMLKELQRHTDLPMQGAEFSIDPTVVDRKERVGLSNYFMIIHQRQDVRPSAGNQIRILPAKLPVLYLNLMMYHRLGIIRFDSNPAFTVQGALDNETLFLIMPLLFAKGLIPNVQLNQPVGGDAISLANAYQSYIGQTVHHTAGIMFPNETQTYFSLLPLSWIHVVEERLRSSAAETTMTPEFLFTDALRFTLEWIAYGSLAAFGHLEKQPASEALSAAYKKIKDSFFNYYSDLKDQTGKPLFSKEEIGILLGNVPVFDTSSGKTPYKLDRATAQPVIERLRDFLIRNQDANISFRDLSARSLLLLREAYYQDHPSAKSQFEDVFMGKEKLSDRQTEPLVDRFANIRLEDIELEIALLERDARQSSVPEHVADQLRSAAEAIRQHHWDSASDLLSQLREDLLHHKDFYDRFYEKILFPWIGVVGRERMDLAYLHSLDLAHAHAYSVSNQPFGGHDDVLLFYVQYFLGRGLSYFRFREAMEKSRTTGEQDDLNETIAAINTKLDGAVAHAQTLEETIRIVQPDLLNEWRKVVEPLSYLKVLAHRAELREEQVTGVGGQGSGVAGEIADTQYLIPKTKSIFAEMQNLGAARPFKEGEPLSGSVSSDSIDPTRTELRRSGQLFQWQRIRTSQLSPSALFSGVSSQPNNNTTKMKSQIKIRPDVWYRARKSDAIALGTKIVKILRKVWLSALRFLGLNNVFIGTGNPITHFFISQHEYSLKSFEAALNPSPASAPAELRSINEGEKHIFSVQAGDAIRIADLYLIIEGVVANQGRILVALDKLPKREVSIVQLFRLRLFFTSLFIKKVLPRLDAMRLKRPVVIDQDIKIEAVEVGTDEARIQIEAPVMDRVEKTHKYAARVYPPRIVAKDLERLSSEIPEQDKQDFEQFREGLLSWYDRGLKGGLFVQGTPDPNVYEAAASEIEHNPAASGLERASAGYLRVRQAAHHIKRSIIAERDWFRQPFGGVDAHAKVILKKAWLDGFLEAILAHYLDSDFLAGINPRAFKKLIEHAGTLVSFLSKKYAEFYANGGIVEKPEESVAVYDDATPGMPKGMSKRQAAVKGFRILGVVALIRNSKGELLVQRRSETENNPLLQDISLIGHVRSGEDPQDALKREFIEELHGGNPDLDPSLKIAEPVSSRDVTSRRVEPGREKVREIKGRAIVYLVTYDGTILPGEEVDSVRFYSREELEWVLANHPEEFTEDFKSLYPSFRNQIWSHSPLQDQNQTPAHPELREESKVTRAPVTSHQLETSPAGARVPGALVHFSSAELRAGPGEDRSDARLPEGGRGEGASTSPRPAASPRGERRVEAGPKAADARRAEINETLPWFQRPVQMSLEPEAVIAGLLEIGRQMKADEARMLPYWGKWDLEDFSYAALYGYQHVIWAFNNFLRGAILPVKAAARPFEIKMRKLHQILAPHTLEIRAGGVYYNHQPTKGSFRELLDFMFGREFDAQVKRDPLKAAASLFVRFVSIQLFSDGGNTRIGNLMFLNFVLMKAGFTPFILTAQNAARYFAIIPNRPGDVERRATEFAHLLKGFVKKAKQEDAPLKSELRAGESNAEQIIRSVQSKRREELGDSDLEQLNRAVSLVVRNLFEDRRYQGEIEKLHVINQVNAGKLFGVPQQVLAQLAGMIRESKRDQASLFAGAFYLAKGILDVQAHQASITKGEKVLIYRESLKLIETALVLEPENKNFLYQYAIALVHVHRWPDALAVAERLTEQGDRRRGVAVVQGQVRVQLARLMLSEFIALLDRHQYDGAYSLMREALAMIDLGKSVIQDAVIPFERGINRDLAQLPHAYSKLSEMAMVASDFYMQAALAPRFRRVTDYAISALGHAVRSYEDSIKALTAIADNKLPQNEHSIMIYKDSLNNLNGVLERLGESFLWDRDYKAVLRLKRILRRLEELVGSDKGSMTDGEIQRQTGTISKRLADSNFAVAQYEKVLSLMFEGTHELVPDKAYEDVSDFASDLTKYVSARLDANGNGAGVQTAVGINLRAMKLDLFDLMVIKAHRISGDDEKDADSIAIYVGYDLEALQKKIGLDQFWKRISRPFEDSTAIKTEIERRFSKGKYDFWGLKLVPKKKVEAPVVAESEAEPAGALQTFVEPYSKGQLQSLLEKDRLQLSGLHKLYTRLEPWLDDEKRDELSKDLEKVRDAIESFASGVQEVLGGIRIFRRKSDTDAALKHLTQLREGTSRQNKGYAAALRRLEKRLERERKSVEEKVREEIQRIRKLREQVIQLHKQYGFTWLEETKTHLAQIDRDMSDLLDMNHRDYFSQPRLNELNQEGDEVHNQIRFLEEHEQELAPFVQLFGVLDKRVQAMPDLISVSVRPAAEEALATREQPAFETSVIEVRKRLLREYETVKDRFTNVSLDIDFPNRQSDLLMALETLKNRFGQLLDVVEHMNTLRSKYNSVLERFERNRGAVDDSSVTGVGAKETAADNLIQDTFEKLKQLSRQRFTTVDGLEELSQGLLFSEKQVDRMLDEANEYITAMNEQKRRHIADQLAQLGSVMDQLGNWLETSIFPLYQGPEPQKVRVVSRLRRAKTEIADLESAVRTREAGSDQDPLLEKGQNVADGVLDFVFSTIKEFIDAENTQFAQAAADSLGRALVSHLRQAAQTISQEINPNLRLQVLSKGLTIRTRFENNLYGYPKSVSFSARDAPVFDPIVDRLAGSHIVQFHQMVSKWQTFDGQAPLLLFETLNSIRTVFGLLVQMYSDNSGVRVPDAKSVLRRAFELNYDQLTQLLEPVENAQPIVGKRRPPQMRETAITAFEHLLNKSIPEISSISLSGTDSAKIDRVLRSGMPPTLRETMENGVSWVYLERGGTFASLRETSAELRKERQEMVKGRMGETGTDVEKALAARVAEVLIRVVANVDEDATELVRLLPGAVGARYQPREDFRVSLEPLAALEIDEAGREQVLKRIHDEAIAGVDQLVERARTAELARLTQDDTLLAPAASSENAERMNQAMDIGEQLTSKLTSMTEHKIAEVDLRNLAVDRSRLTELLRTTILANAASSGHLRARVLVSDSVRFQKIVNAVLNELRERDQMPHISAAELLKLVEVMEDSGHLERADIVLTAQPEAFGKEVEKVGMDRYAAAERSQSIDLEAEGVLSQFYMGMIAHLLNPDLLKGRIEMDSRDNTIRFQTPRSLFESVIILLAEIRGADMLRRRAA